MDLYEIRKKHALELLDLDGRLGQDYHKLVKEQEAENTAWKTIPKQVTDRQQKERQDMLDKYKRIEARLLERQRKEEDFVLRTQKLNAIISESKKEPIIEEDIVKQKMKEFIEEKERIAKKRDDSLDL